MFRWCNRGCTYVNNSRYSLVRHQARCSYICIRDNLQPSAASVVAQEIKIEERLEELDPSRIQHQLERLDNDTTDCLEADNRLKGVPDFAVSPAKCLLDLCTSFNSSKVEEQFFIYFGTRRLTLTRLENTFWVLQTATGLKPGCCSKMF